MMEAPSVKRVVVVVLAAVVLACGLAVDMMQPACGCTPFEPVKLWAFVRASPGWSVGLVTVTASGGESRVNPRTGDQEISIKVAATSWAGTIPATLWVPDGAANHPLRLLRAASSSLTPSSEPFRPGTQWVVKVQNPDVLMSSHALPVVGGTVRIPRGHIAYGPGPRVVRLNLLRALAQRQ